MSERSADEYTRALEAQADQIAFAAAAHLLETRPSIAEKLGDKAVRVWTEHLRQRLLELCAALTTNQPEIFTDRVCWSRAAMRARGMETADLAASLTSLRSALRPFMEPDERSTAATCLDAAVAALAEGAAAPEDRALDPGLAAERVAIRYIQATIAGNTLAGMGVVLDAVDDGMSPRDAIINILLPAQREVGRLWHQNEISIAEEHMVSVTTQRLMALLAAREKPARDRGQTVLAAAVAGNIHDIGIRAIAYLFELDGWRTIFLGSDVPRRELPAALECFDTDLVLLSLALSSQIPVLQRTIESIREHSGERVKILVGGNGLNHSPELWKGLGADGYAETADAALTLGHELLEN
jgi:methanogenic corrinoid protein MtbC1